MPAKYPEEIKGDVVAVVPSSGLSQGQVAHRSHPSRRDFGISTHSVQRWVATVRYQARSPRTADGRRLRSQPVEILDAADTPHVVTP